MTILIPIAGLVALALYYAGTARAAPGAPVHKITAKSGVVYDVQHIGDTPGFAPGSYRVRRGGVTVLMYLQPPGSSMAARTLLASPQTPHLAQARRDFGV